MENIQNYIISNLIDNAKKSNSFLTKKIEYNKSIVKILEVIITTLSTLTFFIAKNMKGNHENTRNKTLSTNIKKE